MKNKLFQSNLFIYFQENLYGFTGDVPLAYIQCQINAPGEHPVVFIDPLQRLPFTKSNKSWSCGRLLVYASRTKYKTIMTSTIVL